MPETLQRISALAIAGLLALPLATGTANATAGAGQAVHINGEGRKICRALASSGAPYWEAKVRGRWLDSYAGTNRFVVRTCFETRRQCLSFTGGIFHIMQGVETVYYASCSER